MARRLNASRSANNAASIFLQSVTEIVCSRVHTVFNKLESKALQVTSYSQTRKESRIF